MDEDEAPRSTVVRLPVRPRTRGDCINGPRPCPWVGCRHNLYLDIRRAGDTVKVNFDVEPDEVQNNTLCSLDYADEAHTLQQIADLMRVTRERIRQLEDTCLIKAQRVTDALGLDLEDLPSVRVDLWETDH
jgi:hypothetical protein